MSAPQTGAGEGLWDAKDVARYLKASRSWVYHHAESGELPCLHVDGLLRFEPAEIREYARKRRTDIVRPHTLPRACTALRNGR